MGTRNRQTLSNYNNRRTNSLQAVKSVGIVLVMAVLSFALGFFVLARLMPSNGPAENTVESANTKTEVPKSEPDTTKRAGTASPAPQPQVSPPVPTERDTSSPQPPPVHQDAGPVLEPEGKSDNATAADVPRRRDRETERAGGGTTEAAPPATSTDDTENSSSKRRRRRRSEDGETIQKPTTPDETERDTDTKSREKSSEETASGETETSTASRSYRVQVGVYSTREGASEERKRLAEQGISTSIVPVRRNGTMRYSLQHGVFKSKENADAARQRLLDAGVDAYVAPR